MSVARMRFMNTTIDNLSMHEVLDAITMLIKKGNNSYVVTPNVDCIVRLETDEELRKAYQGADLVLTDGKPLIWISKLYGTPIKEKVSGSDLFPLLCKMAAEKNYRMFFLGAAEGVAAKAAEYLTNRYPGLQVIGTYSPPFGFENDSAELQRIQDMIKETKPHILILGLGCPKQEKYIFHNKDKLDVPVSLCLGASLDFAAGHVKRAPKWMSECGFEWLYRLFQEPRRMIKRYLVDDIKIVKLIWKYKP